MSHPQAGLRFKEGNHRPKPATFPSPVVTTQENLPTGLGKLQKAWVPRRGAGERGTKGRGGEKMGSPLGDIWVPLHTPHRPHPPSLVLSPAHHPPEWPPTPLPASHPCLWGLFSHILWDSKTLEGAQEFVRHKFHPSPVTALGFEKPSSGASRQSSPTSPSLLSSRPLGTQPGPARPAGPGRSKYLSSLRHHLPRPPASWPHTSITTGLSPPGSYLIRFPAQNGPPEGREAGGCSKSGLSGEVGGWGQVVEAGKGERPALEVWGEVGCRG